MGESTMNSCAIDIETDGLNPTKIHCLVVWNMVKSSGVVLSADSIFRSPKGVADYLRQFDKVVAHNGIAFDFPVLKELWGVEVPESKQEDTLVMSRMARPDRKGGHSLKSWGDRLGLAKTEYTGSWKKCTDEMIDYCVNDVEVTAKLYNHLFSELDPVSYEAISAEYDMQRVAVDVEKTGFGFDIVSAYKLYAKLLKKQKEIVLAMQDVFPPSIVQLKTKTKLVPFNPASRKQIGERLIAKGWKPREFTPTGQPKVDESTLEGCDIEEAKVLATYFMLQKRTGMIKSWLEASDGDRVHCNFHTLGAVTHRMSCSNPNLQQIPSMRKPYGEECRKLWVPERNHVLIDTDAKSLELRVLAHYMNDPKFMHDVLEGDVHSENQRRAGLPTRDAAKTFIYALCYGAGDAKLGTVVNGTAKDGKELRERFLSNLPAFTKLRKAVILKGETRGHVRAIDGRKLHVRHPHASLNTLIQGSSAVLMKAWFTNVHYSLGLEKSLYDFNGFYYPTYARIVAMVHDELVIETHKKSVDSVSECVKIAIQTVNSTFKLRCPLDCDVITGNNWSEIH